jgi:hypothetical protein
MILPFLPIVGATIFAFYRLHWTFLSPALALRPPRWRAHIPRVFDGDNNDRYAARGGRGKADRATSKKTRAPPRTKRVNIATSLASRGDPLSALGFNQPIRQAGIFVSQENQ